MELNEMTVQELARVIVNLEDYPNNANLVEELRAELYSRWRSARSDQYRAGKEQEIKDANARLRLVQPKLTHHECLKCGRQMLAPVTNKICRSCTRKNGLMSFKMAGNQEPLTS